MTRERLPAGFVWAIREGMCIEHIFSLYFNNVCNYMHGVLRRNKDKAGDPWTPSESVASRVITAEQAQRAVTACQELPSNLNVIYTRETDSGNQHTTGCESAGS